MEPKSKIFAKFSSVTLKKSFGSFKSGVCVKNVWIISVLPAVDGGQSAPSLENKGGILIGQLKQQLIRWRPKKGKFSPPLNNSNLKHILAVIHGESYIWRVLYCLNFASGLFNYFTICSTEELLCTAAVQRILILISLIGLSDVVSDFLGNLLPGIISAKVFKAFQGSFSGIWYFEVRLVEF